jgi:hypothetical protein
MGLRPLPTRPDIFSLCSLALKRWLRRPFVGLLKGLKTTLEGLKTAPDELHGSEPFSTGQLREVLEF